MTDVSIRTMLLEFVDANGASHIRELHIEILRHKPDTPEHTVRARLSEAVSDGLLDRLGDGFYDVYAEDEGMTLVVSYPNRSSLWGNSSYGGNCDGRLIKDLILRYKASRILASLQVGALGRCGPIAFYILVEPPKLLPEHVLHTLPSLIAVVLER